MYNHALNVCKYFHASSPFHHVYMLHPHITPASPASAPFGGSSMPDLCSFFNPVNKGFGPGFKN